MHTEIQPICVALQTDVKYCKKGSVGISFISASKDVSDDNLNQLEPNFMYTQIFKKIFLDMNHDKQAIKDFAEYCRVIYENKDHVLKLIDEFERDYCPETSISWYTLESFVYHMLNRGLRNLEGGTIIQMRFIITDLHQQIER